MAIGHVGIVDATIVEDAGRIGMDTNQDRFRLISNLCDNDIYGGNPCTGADVSWEEIALDCFEEPQHKLIEPTEPQTEFCLGDSSSLIHFDKLQTPWTIQFQNLQRLKCIHVAALGKRKTFLIEQMPSLCFLRLLNELCYLESRQEIETFHLHKQDTLYDLPGQITFYSNHVHSKRKQGFDDVNIDKFNGSTQHQTDGAQRVFKQLKNALFRLIFQVSVSLHFAQKCQHVVILAILLTEAACTDVYINCIGHGVSVTSYKYPDVLIDIIAPEGRMILLNFDYVSLRPKAYLIISDIIEPIQTKNYYGGREPNYPPFLSRNNKLQITPVLVGSSGEFNITASCYEISESNAGRLVDGISPAEGFLELSTQSESGGEWMRVCEENLSHRVAEIVCGELGYAIVKEVAYDNGECQSGGSGGNCVRAPVCEEYAYRLRDCSPPSTNCTSSKAVNIKCFEPGFIGCYNHGINQLQNGSIYSSTPECVSSCRSNTVKALAVLNGSQQHGQQHAQCFCPTTDDINLSDLTVEAACTHPVYDASVGFCDQTDDVMNGSWDFKITWFGSIVHLKCDDGYHLIGSGALQCVPGVSPFLPQWNDSMPTCEIDAPSEDTTPFTIGTDISTFDHGHDDSPNSGTTSWNRDIVITITGVILPGIIVLVAAIIVYYCHKHNKHMGKGRQEVHCTKLRHKPVCCYGV